MAYNSAKLVREYSHPNFNGSVSRVEVVVGDIFTVVHFFNASGDPLGVAQLKPGDGGGYEIDVHRNSSQLTVNVVDNF